MVGRQLCASRGLDAVRKDACGYHGLAASVLSCARQNRQSAQMHLLADLSQHCAQ
jgi:hypothetical protein